jgi:hypothetical protein
MNQEELILQLEDLADRLNIHVQYESMKNEDPLTFGGYCRVQDQHRIIVHAKAGIGRKIDIFTEALRHFKLDELYLKPALREYLKKTIDS